jgi:hypothetical protein
VKGFSFGRKTKNILLFPISAHNDWVLKVEAFPYMGVIEAQEKQWERRSESKSDLSTPSTEQLRKV